MLLLLLVGVAGAGLAASPPPAPPALPVPEDCRSAPYRDGAGGGLALHCTLSAINSHAERTNFSVVPAQHTVSLTVDCADRQAESRLEPRGFRSLVWLEELTLQHCNLQRLPDRAFLGLTRLRGLTVRSSAPGTLTLTRGSFEGLANLQRLDLSNNRVRLIEPGVLCSLPNLVQLSLGAAHLASLADLGLTSLVSQPVCLRKVRQLDLSHNQLTELTATHLHNFPGLTSLDVSHNLLSSLSADTLEFAPNLQELFLSNNQLTSVPVLLLEGLKLTSLSLANNSLFSLPAALLTGQTNLTSLDLSGNLLTGSELRPAIFSSLASLTSLSLARNRLEKVKRKLFWELHALQSLDLSQNQLREVPSRLLKSQSQLTSLSLSGNLLEQLGSEALAGAGQLHHLRLDTNSLDRVAEQVWQNLSSLSVLELSNNRLTAVPPGLRFLRGLTLLDLAGNRITELGEQAVPLQQLWRLDLSSNRIANISAADLKHLSSLQILDLSKNRIEAVEREAFAATKQIRAVRLDSNHLVRMDNLFHQLPNLTWLNISDNRIEVFDYAMVPRNLLWLDIHKNRIQSLENYFGIDDGTTLQHIDAGFNQISNIGPLNVPKTVEILLLNDNEITQLASFTFSEKTRLKKVDLSVNRMSTVDRNWLRVHPELPNLPKFLLGGNPIECDCQMVWLKTVNEKAELQSLPLIADLESIYCKLPYSRELSFAPLVEASPLDFLCSYTTHCFALCHCCDYDACDCEMACPSNCGCFHDNTWTKNIAQCSSANFTALPPKLPMDATELYLDGNNITSLRSHTFIGRNHLRVLFLNNSNIQLVANNSFNGLPALTVLHLEHNRITKLEGDEFQGLAGLLELHLQHNMISSISNITFRQLGQLELLQLEGNLLAVFPVWQITISSPQLATLGLVGNPWSCDCHYTHQLSAWLQLHSHSVPGAELLSCAGEEGVALLGGGAGECSTQPRTVSSSSSRRGVAEEGTNSPPGAWLVSLVAVVVASTTIIITATLVFLYRQQLRVWLHYKYGLRFFQRVDGEAEQEKIFDVFVVHSGADEMFASQVLAPELELGQSHYRLCLYQRDLPALQYVADALVQASEASRRTLLILSDSFLKQEWSRYDFRSGLNQSLRAGGGRRLIVITLGDVAERDIDPELRLHLKAATVVRWGEGKFWQKLRFWLPDLSVHAMSQSTTLQSYPPSAQYEHSEIYRPLSPRYQALPRHGDHIYQVCY